jgi:hypothetical protein
MDRIARAADFFTSHGRDIDQAQFRFHFANASMEELLDALGRYQNQDGGFGNGLEPDISAPDSNPFATELALRIYLDANVPTSHPLVQRTVQYLEETQEENGNWGFSAGVYEHTMAPWFQGWTWPSLNPSCTLAGLLRSLGVGSQRLHRRVEALFQQMASPTQLLGDEYYAIRPYAYYFLPEWDHPQREMYNAGVLWWLIRQDVEDKLPDAGHFFDYARSPETYTGANLPRQIMDSQLDRLEAEQAQDGGWPSPYNEAWRGPTSVANLLTLRRFGRV